MSRQAQRHLQAVIKALGRQHPELSEALKKWSPKICRAAEVYVQIFPGEDAEDVHQDLLAYVVASLDKYESSRSSLPTFVYMKLHHAFINMVNGRYLQRYGYECVGQGKRSGNTLGGFRTYVTKQYRRSITELPEHDVSILIAAHRDRDPLRQRASDDASLYDLAPNDYTPVVAWENAERLEAIRGSLSEDAYGLFQFLVDPGEDYLDRVRRMHMDNYRRRFGLCEHDDLDVRDQQALLAEGSPRDDVMTAFGSGMRYNCTTCARVLGITPRQLARLQDEIFEACAAYEASR